MQGTRLAELHLLSNLFLHGILQYFYYIHKKWFKIKFSLKTSLALKKDKCLSVGNILMLKCDEAIW